MYEQQCAMPTLYHCFANVNAGPYVLFVHVVSVLATVESNFNMYTGFQYHSIHSHSIHSFSG